MYGGPQYPTERAKLAAELDSDITLPCDVEFDEQIDATFSALGERWDSLDILVHAVAYAPREALQGDYLDAVNREACRIAHDISSYSFAALAKAAQKGDLFVTLTGDIHVIRLEHFKKMKDGAIVCNSGHFDCELDLPALRKATKKRRMIRPSVEEFILGGKRINILAEGRLVNLSAAEGHPAMVMDMSFANQALAAEYVVKNHKKLKRQVYTLPEKIDAAIAALKLRSMGITIDKLTAEQKEYLASWEMGT